MDKELAQLKKCISDYEDRALCSLLGLSFLQVRLLKRIVYREGNDDLGTKEFDLVEAYKQDLIKVFDKFMVGYGVVTTVILRTLRRALFGDA